MTDENTPTNDVLAVGDTAEQPVRRTRARRVATSGTTTPRSSAPVVDAPEAAQPTAPATPAAQDATGAAPVKAPARTRARRATSTAAPAAGSPAPALAPVTTEPSELAAAAGKTSDVLDTPGAPGAAPERPKRSRRATSSGARATAATTAPEAPEPADEPQEQAAATEPVKAPRQRRSRSATAATSTAASGATPDAKAAPTDSPASGAPGGLDVLAELGAPRTVAAPVADAPRLATTALLFQAPDPTRRSRRAQAPAGPPRQDDPAAVVPAEEDEDAAENAAEDAAENASAEQDDVEQSARSGRTSRSTRGRRSRGARSQDLDEPQAPVVTTGGLADDDGQDSTQDDDLDEVEGDGAEGDEQDGAQRRRRRRGGRGRRSRSGGGDRPEESGEDDDAAPSRGRGRAPASVEPEDGDDENDESDEADDTDESDEGGSSSSRRRRRRRRGSRGDAGAQDEPAAPTASTRTRTRTPRAPSDEVTALKGSTRLEAKRQRRREGRDAGRRRSIVTESEFLARRESVERSMIVREANDRVQIAVLEDGVLVEHFVSRSAQNAQSSMAGNVYLGRVQNVLPSMEAAFVDVGKGRNAVLYAGEVNWDAAGLEGQPRRIEQALKSGDSVLVQVTKDPIGHKGARLTSQITLAGRYLVYVPGGGMTGISRKLPENERARLKKLLKEIVPDAAGVIVRTAAEGASEDELRRDVQRLQDQWAAIEKKSKSATAPALLQGEPDLEIRVVRDIFNDDFSSLVVQGDGVWSMISEYVDAMAPDLAEKVSRWTGTGDVFAAHRIDEQLAKGMDRKVWLPSGGSLVIDRTEAMTVVDVNTGKFTGSGGTLEETVTRNNIEAAEEIVRQLRLRDIGGIIVIDFIDMVLESNRDLVLRRLVECLGRDRTKHQVAEVTSLGLVQMTRKRVGQGLVEAFSETCQHCNGRGFIVHTEPIEQRANGEQDGGRQESAPDAGGDPKRSRRKKAPTGTAAITVPVLPQAREAVKATLATIAAAAAHAHDHDHDHPRGGHDLPSQPEAPAEQDGLLEHGEAVASEPEPAWVVEAGPAEPGPAEPDWVVVSDPEAEPVPTDARGGE